MTQCQAKAKRTGAQCQAQAIRGRTVCRVHGGMTPRGFALPQTTTGRFSKDLPTALVADYQAALSDPELIACREDLAVVTAREGDLVRAIRDAEPGSPEEHLLWERLLTTVEARRRLADTERRRLEAAQQMITTERAMLLVAALVDAVRRHVDDRRILDAIGRELERLVVADGAHAQIGSGDAE